MSEETPNTITLRMPKINVQLVLFILVVAIAALQTVQLWRLSGKGISVKASTAGTSAAPAAAGGASNGLQGMVGGC